MSGKSTLLRTVGVNAVLAQAGAPVRARRLRLSPLAVGTSMRIADSLQAGTSRFYAEIQRLRQLVDLAAGPRPLLFLLDEILHGTNSHDRRIGAEADRARPRRAAAPIGLVTTHDLSLATIADALAPRAANVHFEDHLENGRMTFDYRLRPGVVQQEQRPRADARRRVGSVSTSGALPRAVGRAPRLHCAGQAVVNSDLRALRRGRDARLHCTGQAVVNSASARAHAAGESPASTAQDRL